MVLNDRFNITSDRQTNMWTISPLKNLMQDFASSVGNLEKNVE